MNLQKMYTVKLVHVSLCCQYDFSDSQIQHDIYNVQIDVQTSKED